MAVQAWGNSTGGLDWFESAIGRPDVVLKDMLTFITPAAAPAGHVTHFFRNIAAGEASKVHTITALPLPLLLLPLPCTVCTDVPAASAPAADLCIRVQGGLQRPIWRPEGHRDLPLGCLVSCKAAKRPWIDLPRA